MQDEKTFPASEQDEKTEGVVPVQEETKSDSDNLSGSVGYQPPVKGNG